MMEKGITMAMVMSGDRANQKLNIKYQNKGMAKKIKKAAKKTVKKVVKKPAAKKTVKKTVKKAAAKKLPLLGVVTHYYSGIGVGIIKCATAVPSGANAHFKGATTDFVQTLDSMQYDRAPITSAKKGQEVGVKVKDRVREGDEVYAVK